MRIVGGSLSGRVLRAPKGAATRPTSEKVREAVFNILGTARVAGAEVLDLFAGSGALGIEALSRGAAHVTFVDASRHALGVLGENLAALDLAARATVVTNDAVRFAAGHGRAAVVASDAARVAPGHGRAAVVASDAARVAPGHGRAAVIAGDAAHAAPVVGEAVATAASRLWRLVFVDPPYASDLAVRAMTALRAEHLAPDATIVIEHDRRHAPPDALGCLLQTDHRRYGDTLVSFYTRAVAP